LSNQSESAPSTPGSRAPTEQVLDALSLGRGLAVLRVFVGLIAFSNGLAKLFSFRAIEIGPYASSLIDRSEAREILSLEIGRNDLPLLPTLVNDVILPAYETFGWLLTFTELGVGALLILGLMSRGAALVAFALHFFLQLVYFSSGRFAFEQPHEWVPPLILAFIASGMVWGLDGRLDRNRDGARWPC